MPAGEGRILRMPRDVTQVFVADALGMTRVLAPVQQLTTNVFAFIPNLIADLWQAVKDGDLKRAMAHVLVKSHANGAKNPKAHLRKAITPEQCLRAPMIADPLGLFDCCGVSDGASAAILTTPDIARGLGKNGLVAFKALALLSITPRYSSLTAFESKSK